MLVWHINTVYASRTSSDDWIPQALGIPRLSAGIPPGLGWLISNLAVE